MNADRVAEVFAPLVVARRAAKREANRTGQTVVVNIMGGSLTVRPDTAERAA